MLKLEKRSEQNDIGIIYRNKEPFYTRSFAIAFGTACAIHLFFLILFHVGPIKFRFEEKMFSPVQVETELVTHKPSIGPAVVAESQHSSRYQEVFFLTPPSIPTLSEHPTFLPMRHSGYWEEALCTFPQRTSVNKSDKLFTSIEDALCLPKFTPVTKPAPEAIRLIISGPLAVLPILQKGSSGKSLQKPAVDGTIDIDRRAVFEILVERRSGRVFWYAPRELTSIVALDRFAEEMVQDLLFLANSDAFVTPGEVEIHFHWDSGE